jgi:hypothetical protein
MQALACGVILLVALTPALLLGSKYRSGALVVSIFATSAFSAVILTVLLFLLESVSPWEGGEGVGAGPMLMGPILGFIAGHVLPVIWWSREQADTARLSTGVLTVDQGILAQRDKQKRTRPGPFDHRTCTFRELEDAARHVNRSAYPERAAELDAEIRRRLSSEGERKDQNGV